MEFLRNLRARQAAAVQAYIDRPVEGRLAPQPNRDLRVTRFVQALFGVK